MKRLSFLFFVLISLLPFLAQATMPDADPQEEIENGVVISIDEEIARQKEKVDQWRQAVPSDKLFEGWYFVIDPGHGDKHLGAWRQVMIGTERKEYHESTFTFDIARRLGWYLRRRGASGIFFTVGPEERFHPDRVDEYSYWHPSFPPPAVDDLITLLPPSPYARGTTQKALSARTEVCNQKVQRFGRDRVIFISIHVDAITYNRMVRGMAFYCSPDGSKRLAEHLVVAAEAADKIIRDESSDSTYHAPIRRCSYIVIRSFFNQAKERVLVETANIYNDNDFYHLKRGDGREEIAHILGIGIAGYVREQNQKISKAKEVQ